MREIDVELDNSLFNRDRTITRAQVLYEQNGTALVIMTDHTIADSPKFLAIVDMVYGHRPHWEDRGSWLYIDQMDYLDHWITIVTVGLP